MSLRSQFIVICLFAFGLQPLAVRAADGNVLLGNLNCTACHAPTAKQAAWIKPKAAPRLNDIGGRADAGWIQRYLTSPHETMPGTTMPDLLSNLPEQERLASVEALTHYLVSLSTRSVRPVFPDRAAVARGEALYHQVGCVACHAPQNGQPIPSASVPLPRMSEKWAFDGLRRFLLNPLESRPAGRMPGMHLTDGEAGDIAHYLLRETQVPAAIELTRFRGRMRALTDLDSAERISTGPVESFFPEFMQRERGFAIRFTTFLKVEQKGSYTFHFKATGASRLSVNGKWVMGEESWENERVDEKSTVELEAGMTPLVLDYVQRGSKGPMLSLEWEGPGIAREPVPSARMQVSKEPISAPVAFVVDATKAARGQALYTKLNCAICHEDGAPAASGSALSKLGTSRGCLAQQRNAKAPDFHLNGADREALRAALKTLNSRELVAPSQREQIALSMKSFGCVACHKRDGIGGVTPERDRYFTSNGEDLGDEGRIPPVLDGVGARLKPEWLRQIIEGSPGVRPYLNTRMPSFGAANVGHMAAIFTTMDHDARVVSPVPDSLESQLAVGRKLVGTDGLSCIACHRFNRQPAHALQVMDMTTVTQRLNEGWFREFLLDPNRFHPGTRMPAFWPQGVSPFPALLGGNAERQFAAIWNYLAEGSRAKSPAGLSRQILELIVGGETVLYRGKLWEAGYRAVAVGYPGQFNAAFDAEEMRLSLLWRGRFLNAGPHWTVQGMGQIRPLGSNVVVFPHGPALAILADTASVWPEGDARNAGFKFRGYQFDSEKNPRLLYSFDKVEVDDFLIPNSRSNPTGIRRTITLSGPATGGLHFRAAAGRIVESEKDTWRFDDSVTIRFGASEKPFVRGTGARKELLVPIEPQGGKRTLEVEYVW